MVFKAHFYVNTDAVVEGARAIGQTFSGGAAGIIQREMEILVKTIIVEELEIAARIGNSENGFPDEFKDHMLANAARIHPDIFQDLHGLTVTFDLEEWLGGYDDLQRAFHQGAKLADGGFLDGPYTGQALHQEDTETRHIFWEALRFGRAKAQIGEKSVPVKGSWEQTMEKYLEIWGEKSPQWLFLQFGQEEWEPYVPQVDILNNIEDAVQGAATAYLLKIFENTVKIANEYKSAGIDVGYTPKGALRVISGTIEANGKVYRPGRFVPKGGIK